jgi:hypothetical protein
MANKVNPFLYPIPRALTQDRETRIFFEYFVRWAHDMWKRTGGGEDEITNAAVREAFPWDYSDEEQDNISELFSFDEAVEPSPQIVFHAIDQPVTRAVTATSDYTALPFDFINAKFGSKITFTEYPSENDIITVRNGDGTKIMLDGNGKTINGSSTGQLTQEGSCIEFYYFIDSDEWVAR